MPNLLLRYRGATTKRPQGRHEVHSSGNTPSAGTLYARCTVSFARSSLPPQQTGGTLGQAWAGGGKVGLRARGGMLGQTCTWAI